MKQNLFQFVYPSFRSILPGRAGSSLAFHHKRPVLLRGELFPGNAWIFQNHRYRDGLLLYSVHMLLFHP